MTRARDGFWIGMILASLIVAVELGLGARSAATAGPTPYDWAAALLRSAVIVDEVDPERREYRRRLVIPVRP